MIESVLYKNVKAVYKITQPDGMFYIGSSINLYTRLRSHKSRSRFNCNWNCLKIEILEEFSEINAKDLRIKEDFYIKKYWSDKIINIEKSSKGRNITGDKNPMKDRKVVENMLKNRDITGDRNPCWRGGLTKIKKTCPICLGNKQYYSKTCYKCKKKD